MAVGFRGGDAAPKRGSQPKGRAAEQCAVKGPSRVPREPSKGLVLPYAQHPPVNAAWGGYEVLLGIDWESCRVEISVISGVGAVCPAHGAVGLLHLLALSCPTASRGLPCALQSCRSSSIPTQVIPLHLLQALWAWLWKSVFAFQCSALLLQHKSSWSYAHLKRGLCSLLSKWG